MIGAIFSEHLQEKTKVIVVLTSANAGNSGEPSSREGINV